MGLIFIPFRECDRYYYLLLEDSGDSRAGGLVTFFFSSTKQKRLRKKIDHSLLPTFCDDGDDDEASIHLPIDDDGDEDVDPGDRHSSPILRLMASSSSSCYPNLFPDPLSPFPSIFLGKHTHMQHILSPT